MEIEEVLQAVMEQPEDDDRRLEYADLIEASDPEHARCIRLGVAGAIRRRNGTRSVYPDEEDELLIRHKERWAHNLIRFLPRGMTSEGRVYSWGLRFDRGFPVMAEIHPYVFLEYADLLFRLAPLRHIRFTKPYGQDTLLPGPVPLREDGTPLPFPLDEILAMPQLARLESFGFDSVLKRDQLPEDVWTRIARCPHLTRCRALDAGGVFVHRADVDALATGPLSRAMVRLDPLDMVEVYGEYRNRELDPLGEVTRTYFDEKGRHAEAKHGYIPWLHPSHCPYDLYDLQYHHERGALPKYPPGSPQSEAWYEVPLRVERPFR